MTRSMPPIKIPSERNPLFVVLDNIRSVYNVGSIFRTSDAARISHLYLCGMTAYPPHPKIDKTALGAISHVPWSHHVDACDVVRELKQQGFPIWACETGALSQNYLESPYPSPLVLVFGHEVIGINPLILTLAEKQIEIPMAGHKSSLNVATAYGIILFEVLRQYRSEPG
ncbi:MAG: RNA methyltransferase [Candidatus Eisenbacteria bacterium]|uniref:RNA methyltransferase n=1 Tax=Eiseniibacteriota bacterium TaxID=2212470 RepID=A0A948W4Q4_UNCEI|nr:RNA methyltransferase [Candidatus Eisenbacteria bacterium]MBU1949251.1 RNA methyltransferase [Candidatus Eisenbacteria bacterium]MBU2689589.1 RNA methyltransferase [Candidatus Eisenbacteria bacterium]